MWGRINKRGELVLQSGKSGHKSSGMKIELGIAIDIEFLISGIDGYVWATRNFQQAEIISNALSVQNIELEIVKIELESDALYLIQLTHKKDITEVINFIQNDDGGLRLKPDWNYPSNEPNQSFEQWINE